MDPLIQKYPGSSSYQFAGNNPIFCIDVDGLEKVYYYVITEHGFQRIGVMDKGDNGKSDRAVIIAQGIGMHDFKGTKYEYAKDVVYIEGANDYKVIARAAKVLRLHPFRIPEEMPDRSLWSGDLGTKHKITIEEVAVHQTYDEWVEDMGKLQWWKENGAGVAMLGMVAAEQGAPGQNGGAWGSDPEFSSGNGAGNSSWKGELLDVNTITTAPEQLWGKSIKEIVTAFKKAGYHVDVEASTKGSKKSTQIRIRGNSEIDNIQVHPGGGRHKGNYYKISTSTKGIIKVVDRRTYKATSGEKAKIIKR